MERISKHHLLKGLSDVVSNPDELKAVRELVDRYVKTCSDDKRLLVEGVERLINENSCKVENGYCTEHSPRDGSLKCATRHGKGLIEQFGKMPGILFSK